MNQLLRAFKALCALVIFVASSPYEPITFNETLACAGSTFGPLYVELVTPYSQVIYGHPQGVSLRLFRYESESEGPATLDDLENRSFTITLSPRSGEATQLISGELVEPEGPHLPGVFIWRPTAPLELGDYSIMCPSCHSDLTISIVEPQEPASFATELQELTLTELEIEGPKACCDLQDCVPEEDWCTGQLTSCETCWVEERQYIKALQARAQSELSEPLKHFLNFQLISTIGDRQFSFESSENLTISITNDDQLPERVCVHLIASHVVTGERWEGEERCLSRDSLITLERRPLTDGDYEEQQLDRWLRCEELTAHQHSILTRSGREVPRETPDRELMSAGSEQGGNEPNETGGQASEEGSCRQTSNRADLMWLILTALILIGFKATRSSH